MARRQRDGKGKRDGELTRPVSPEAVAEFKALTSGDYDNFACLSVNYDGEPTVAVVAVTRDGADYIMTPMYVRLTERMKDKLLDPDGRALSGTR